MQPLTATAANPPEDIDAVLGRFQAWSATRKPAVKTPPRSSDLPEGVRELSYEEALESSRFRWQAHIHPSPTEVSIRETEPPADDPPSPTSAQEAATRFDAEAIQPDKLSLSSVVESVDHRATSPDRPRFGAVLAEALPGEPDPDPDLGPLALIWPAPPKNERQVSMSLRVAASEQALIKARAAEAGLSVSAYLRQCALEVEKLRAQVHHTLALLEQKSEQRSENHIRSLTDGGSPATPAAGSFFGRFRELVFGRPTRLTLRA